MLLGSRTFRRNMKELSEYITEYISSGRRRKPSTIKATNNTIKKIVKQELDRLGLNADLNHIDVSDVTDMTGLFSCNTGSVLGPKYADLNPDISGWDVSKVVSMETMFWKCKKFDCDISEWKVGRVGTMYGMFMDCESFNQDISGWDVGQVRNMYGMFWNCKNFNRDISRWKVGNVWIMDNMFNGCEKFNHDISKWDVNDVTDYEDIFDNCPIKEEYKPKFK